ncbi:MAG: DNA primase [Bacteroidales bacterium]|jgi:DNA primase|nr:DNA primase [Bacteroidales bacterium]MCI2122372.1 DNA primase [Bacteroidales bacterium]MCI2146264.1 DNA primase [Bacteroidales bacterium]
MIDKQTVDRILDAVKIEEVIGDFVTLKRRGANYIGLCPFHEDRNPSMSVSPSKGIFKCFACGKAGTAVTFVMEHEHMTYPEALRYLARKYNIEIEEKEETPEEATGRLKYESLILITEAAQKYFQDILWNTEEGKAIGLSYFRERKFTDETIRKFGLGFAPKGRNNFLSWAKSKGYNPDLLVDAGMCIRRDDGELTDRFYNRVIFPISAIGGRVIGFGARTLIKDEKPKYVNSPESLIYDKKHTLYGITQAKGEISKRDKCYLVEGYADVISMHQAGICNLVASSGTSLTQEQVLMIKRFTNNITVMYDGDAAGQHASLRGVDMILGEGMNVKVVTLPPEDDPDSYAKAHTHDEILTYMERHENDFIVFKSELLMKDAQQDPIKKAGLINDVIESLSMIPDAVTRTVYVNVVADKFDVKTDVIFNRINELRERRKRNEAQRNPYPQRSYEPEIMEQATSVEGKKGITNIFLAPNEKELVYYLIKFGPYRLIFPENMVYGAPQTPAITVAQYMRSELEKDDESFTNPLYKNIYDEFYATFGDVSYTDDEHRDAVENAVLRHFTNNRDKEVIDMVVGMLNDAQPLTIKQFRTSIVPEEDTLGEMVPKSLNLYKFKVLEFICRQLTAELGEAQKNGDTERRNLLLAKLKEYSRAKTSVAKSVNRLT